MLRRSAVVVLAALLASGCYSTSTGYQGKLTFAYESNLVDHANFVKPLAPGAKLDVVAFVNGSEKTMSITKVTSSRPEVVKASLKDDRTITLLGAELGVADVEITARDPAGNTLVDRMFFHVAKPERHLISHGCTEQPEAVYVRGAEAWITHELATADNRPVVGYDYVPVTINPPGGVELIDQPKGFPQYLYKLPDQNGRVALTSKVDRSAITLRVVDRQELKEARLVGSGGRMFEGSRTYVGAHVLAGTTPVCSQNALTKARSLTPDLCDVSADLEDDEGAGRDDNHEQLALVKAKAFGICKYELTLPELDGGRGVKLLGEVDIGRYEFPRPREERAAGSACGRRWDRPLFAGSLVWLFGGLFVLPNLLGMGLLALGRRRRK